MSYAARLIQKRQSNTTHIFGWPALTAMCSTALPLTASCLSPLLGFEFWPGHINKLTVTWGWVAVFAGYSSFFHQLQLASHDIAVKWQKDFRKTAIPNRNFV